MTNTPKISIVMVAYNMAREIPRTILSYSTRMQKWVNEKDYEIIVVDNGSYQPFDESLCRQYASNISFIYMDNPTHSPCQAINQGLAAAKGNIIGVCVDGARMASPGLLRMVMDASQINPDAIIGTLAFHLGNEVQSKSIHKGYNQSVEDELLESVPWQDNGYHLFNICAPGSSSRRGWFEKPAESNALFMARHLWDKLGGYDEAFASKAGGLANHDIWARSNALPHAQIFVLLGEGTFHQFHGGEATNSKIPKFDKFQKEYERLRGHRYKVPEGTPISYGRLNDWAKTIKWP